MPTVVIDGIEYVPRVDINPINDVSLNECLKVLTEMRYFGEKHKMSKLALNAIKALSPSLAELDEHSAYKLLHEDKG